jgi:hypothetical protein
MSEVLKFPWYAFTRDAECKAVASSGFCELIGGLVFAAGLIAAVVLSTS